MFYPRAKEEKLDEALFKNPSSEYRGAPFWAWNDKLDREELIRQIHIFKEMGFGGFHMHVRTGLDTDYLSDEYMEDIRLCIDEAKKLSMLGYLYDEDRWPSGTCGGRVTKDHPEFARKSLLFTIRPERADHSGNEVPEAGRGQEARRQENGRLLAVYDLAQDREGYLVHSELLWKRTEGEDQPDEAVIGAFPPEEAPEGRRRWYAYEEHNTADPWFNNQAYVDTLHPEAVKRFIELTHERYREAIGDEFGQGTRSIFTDEPQFMPKKPADFALIPRDAVIPWTTGLDRLYEERFGEDLWPLLPGLFFEQPGRLPRVRLRMQNLVTDRFVESYCAQTGQWCEAHGLLLTGHINGEPTLHSQTQSVGDAMRAYESFGIPGIDMLCDFHEYTTAKQAASRVRQLGKEGMLSELYGVTGWDYDFRGYKLQGDWQAALGVTLRVPHLAWLSMHGEAKRDYPACIGYQSPWWRKYSLIEDHFARLGTVLTRGHALSRVGVIHPIESYWLRFGPGDQTGDQRNRMEQQFAGLCETLLFGKIDFDYIDEACLVSDDRNGRVKITGHRDAAGDAVRLGIGPMNYEFLLVPPLLTIRRHTVEWLAAFERAGGRVLWQGEKPMLIDGDERTEARDFTLLDEAYESAEKTGMDAGSVLKALEPIRFLEIRTADGRREPDLIYQLRQDGDTRWLFICRGRNPVSPDVDPSPELQFSLMGIHQVTEYDTMNGAIRPVSVRHVEGKTVFGRIWHMHDSLLLRLEKAEAEDGEASRCETEKASTAPYILLGKVPVQLEEPNMLLLDLAEYRFETPGDRQKDDFDGWYAEEELLRIDNLVRARLGIPLRKKEVAQPYTLPEEDAAGNSKLWLRFHFESDAAFEGAKLALETPDVTRIWLNGEEVDSRSDGWFVDHCIRTVPLPPIRKGINEIILQAPIGPRTNLEDAYLLGDFSVRLNGTEKRLSEPVKKIGFGDIVPQGLPFYTGNLIYRTRIRTAGDFTVRVPQYRGGLVEILLDGQPAGEIVYSPYELSIRTTAGDHELGIRLYGTRQNGFAQLHHTQGVYFYQSPNSWRSDGDLWTYEYQLKKAGILTSPQLRGAVFLREDEARNESERI